MLMVSGPSLVAMVVTLLPSPTKIPAPPASRFASNTTWPESLIAGLLPNPEYGPNQSAMVVYPSPLPLKTPRPNAPPGPNPPAPTKPSIPLPLIDGPPKLENGG